MSVLLMVLVLLPWMGLGDGMGALMLAGLCRYLPEYGFLARAHDAAVNNGTLSGLVSVKFEDEVLRDAGPITLWGSISSYEIPSLAAGVY